LTIFVPVSYMSNSTRSEDSGDEGTKAIESSIKHAACVRMGNNTDQELGTVEDAGAEQGDESKHESALTSEALGALGQNTASVLAGSSPVLLGVHQGISKMVIPAKALINRRACLQHTSQKPDGTGEGGCYVSSLDSPSVAKQSSDTDHDGPPKMKRTATHGKDVTKLKKTARHLSHRGFNV
jgi:hypothetical protein